MITQTEKAKQIGMAPSHYSRTLTRLKTKSFLTDNDKKVLDAENLVVIIIPK